MGVLGDTEDRWKDIFSKAGKTYREPKLAIFSGQMPSRLRAGESRHGAVLLPQRPEVYLDTSFFRDLETQFRGCSGKACHFSKAYVIAHEVGHHVQNLLGILPKVQQPQRASRSCRC